MPRLFYAGALLGLATLVPGPMVAQNTPKTERNDARNGARVERVVVRGTGAAMEVEIQTSGAPVAPDTQAIAGPDRIMVDFPGALPAAELRALAVHRGALKRVRSGLFFSNPPITRIVLDLVEPQSYRISTIQNGFVVKLGPAADAPSVAAGAQAPNVAVAPAAKLLSASLAADTNAAGTKVAAAKVPAAVANAPPLPAVSAAPPPFVAVTFVGGMLSIRAEKATLAQVLFEVQRQTHAEIAIPAGAEQEEVVADLGPAPAREVLASLLNGSVYNFIFVGDEVSLERVILTRRDPNIF